MQGFISFYKGLKATGKFLKSPLLLAMRLYWGYMFFISGLGKIGHVSDVAEYFGTLGIPFPEINAYLAAYTECIGGLCLMIGLASRLVSIPLAITMIVALSTAHIEALKNTFSDPQGLISQLPFNYLLTAIIVFVFGPGKISVDYILERLFFKSDR